jgi:hypothetical protein
MSKSFGRRMSNTGKGGFTDFELRRIRLHEAAQDQRNGVAGSEEIAIGSLVYVYAKRAITASWHWLLETTRRLEVYNKKHSVHEPPWSEFPCTSADIDRIIRWRAANPRGVRP